MASSITTDGGAATAAPRRRIRKKRVSYKRLMTELIGRTNTRKLLAGQRVTLNVQGGPFKFAEVKLHPPYIVYGHERCINASNVNQLLDKAMGRKVLDKSEELNLSWMYPKLMLLLSNPYEFNRKAG